MHLVSSHGLEQERVGPAAILALARPWIVWTEVGGAWGTVGALTVGQPTAHV